MQEIETLQSRFSSEIAELRKVHASFDEAFSTYTAQYGDRAVKLTETCKISETIDPVIVILGRTTPLVYRDSKRTLAGGLATVQIEKGQVYILGRREPPDSKLIVWSRGGESEIEQYDSRVRIIPSRVHAAIFGLENGDVLFTDLGSSSGSILAGESSKPEPFITLYAAPKVGIRRVAIPSKYAEGT